MIKLLLNILTHQNNDKKLGCIFLTCVMMCNIVLQNFNLKLHYAWRNKKDKMY
jgi:hypothetical protein